MNKKQYEAMRKQLMDAAERLITEGKLEDANAKMAEISALDDKWENTTQALANLRAMSDEAQASIVVSDAITPENNAVVNGEDILKTDDYKNAWAKSLMGKTLTKEETRAFEAVNDLYANVTNAYTHTTKNTPLIVPETVTKGIWEQVGEMYPYFADISKTYVKGMLTIIQEETSSDSGWYDEDTATEDGKETFKAFTLSGCELSRSITVSWKLKEMAIEDFISYIQRRLAKKMGAAAGYGVTHGAGVTTSGKPEPMGVVTALKAEESTPQVIEYNTMPSYKNLLDARSRIKTGYGTGVRIYANSNTIWTKLTAIVDNNGRPIFISDASHAGEIRILGMIVKEDDSMRDGEVLLSNPIEGYLANINKETAILNEDHVKARTTDYCAYSIIDGNVTTTVAHALLIEGTNVEETPSQEESSQG